MANTKQVQYNKAYHDRHGIKQKKFALDIETISLLEKLATATKQNHTAVFKAALNVYAEQVLK